MPIISFPLGLRRWLAVFLLAGVGRVLAGPVPVPQPRGLARHRAPEPDTLSLAGLLVVQWEGVRVLAPEALAAQLARVSPTDTVTVLVRYTHRSGNGFLNAQAAVHVLTQYLVAHGVDPARLRGDVQWRPSPTLVNDYPFRNCYVVRKRP